MSDKTKSKAEAWSEVANNPPKLEMPPWRVSLEPPEWVTIQYTSDTSYTRMNFDDFKALLEWGNEWFSCGPEQGLRAPNWGITEKMEEAARQISELEERRKELAREVENLEWQKLKLVTEIEETKDTRRNNP